MKALTFKQILNIPHKYVLVRDANLSLNEYITRKQGIL